MSIYINATIEEMRGENYNCIFVTFPQDFVMQILGRFAGLQIDRYNTLVIQGGNSKLIISKKEMMIKFCGIDRPIENKLTQDVLDVIVGCCYDKAFAIYDSPHIDIEFKNISLTFLWS